MKHGHIKAWLCKLLMYGAAGSGKTSTKELILGNPPPINRVSTPLAMRPTTIYRVNLEGKKWAKLTTLEERKMFLARALIKDAPTLVHHMLAIRPKVASFSTNEPVSNTNQPLPQTYSKFDDQFQPPDQSKHLPSSDQLTSAMAESAISRANGSGDSNDSDILQSISINEELVKLMDQLSTTKDPPNRVFRILHIIDSGGQPQFHEILPIFLQKLSFYVFVFRLSDELTKQPVVEFYVDGKPLSTPYTSAQSIEQLLQHCVQTMHSHRSSPGSEDDCPQIMILGTHVDEEKKSEETRDEKNKKILKTLSPLFEKQVLYHNLSAKEVIFPINAKVPGDNEKAITEQIRQVLLGNSLVKPAADIPLKWFALEILLEEMAQALQQGVLSKSQCITVAIEKLHFEEDAVDAAFKYLHQLSVLHYYPSILPNVLFANPQILLDKVSELVFKSVEIKELPKKQALCGEWRKFHEFGCVSVKFLSQEVFMKHYVPGLFETNDLVMLFQKLLIFAKISDSELFVPALLRNLSSKDVDKHRLSADSFVPPLVLVFPGGVPRQGIFCSLLCWLVSLDNHSPAPWSITCLLYTSDAADE